MSLAVMKSPWHGWHRQPDSLHNLLHKPFIAPFKWILHNGGSTFTMFRPRHFYAANPILRDKYHQRPLVFKKDHNFVMTHNYLPGPFELKPVTRDHLSSETTFFWRKKWSFKTGSTTLRNWDNMRQHNKPNIVCTASLHKDFDTNPCSSMNYKEWCQNLCIRCLVPVFEHPIFHF